MISTISAEDFHDMGTSSRNLSENWGQVEQILFHLGAGFLLMTKVGFISKFIPMNIQLHWYWTKLIKKSCWDSEFSSHFGCVQHPHPHFHIMFYSMQFPFSKPPTDWLYLGYSGPGVSGKGFLGNWKSHSRFKRNTGRGRELENATGREIWGS